MSSRALTILALSGSVAMAAAQTTTVDVMLPMLDVQVLDASIVAADSKATTYAFHCRDGSKPEDCGFTDTWTLIQGPSTVSIKWHLTGEGTYTQDLACQLDFPKDMATCDVTVTQSHDGTTFSSNTHAVNTGLSSVMVPLTVTAGVDKLSAATAASTKEASTTTAAPKSSATDAAATNTNTIKTSATASASDSDSSSASASPSGSQASQANAATTKSENAAPMATHHAVLAGVAAVVGGAMML